MLWNFSLLHNQRKAPFQVITDPAGGAVLLHTRERGVSLWYRTTHILHHYMQWPQTNLRNSVPRADRNSLVFQEWRKVSLILTRLNYQSPLSLQKTWRQLRAPLHWDLFSLNKERGEILQRDQVIKIYRFVSQTYSIMASLFKHSFSQHRLQLY